MEPMTNKPVLTSKYMGFVGICLFLYLIFVFMDSFLTGLGALSGAAAAGKNLFVENSFLFLIILIANIVYVPFSLFCGVVFWTKRLWTIVLLRIYFLSLIAFKLFELILSFIPEVTKVSGFSATLMDSILVKLVLGIMCPLALVIYLFRPDRKIEMQPVTKPRSDD
jgi:hypothetical protein